MLDVMFYMFVGVGILLLGFSIAREDAIWPVLGTIIWIVVAVGSFSIERVASYLVENASSPTGYSVVETTSNYSGGWPFGLLFMGIAIVMMLFAWDRILEQFAGRRAGGG